MIPRSKGIDGWQANWDAYNDVPDGGLAESQAAVATRTVEKVVVPGGIRVSYVDNDNRPRAYEVEWPEIVALAHGQNPSDPRIMAGQGWTMVNVDGLVFPCFIPQGAPANPVMVHIEMAEARDAMARYRHFWQRDQRAVRLAQALQGGR